MIAVIVCSLLFILAVLLIIVAIVIADDTPVWVCIVLVCIVAFVLPISLVNGKSIYKQDVSEYIAEKEEIEYILENKPSMYIIEQAKEYNNKVQTGNNLWCRFNIEDRSEYMIDINSYFNKKEDVEYEC